jgi:RNase H-fold protein (predicted Holliday junction resolvase)
MKIKALANFAHASKKAFIEGRTYEVSEKSAAEFINGGLAVEVTVTDEEAKTTAHKAAVKTLEQAEKADKKAAKE